MDALPLHYDLAITSNPPGNVLAFSTETNVAAEAHLVNTARGANRRDDVTERVVAICGTIQHECNVLPPMDEKYRQIMRLRRE